jgi:hypothetical protein
MQEGRRWCGGRSRLRRKISRLLISKCAGKAVAPSVARSGCGEIDDARPAFGCASCGHTSGSLADRVAVVAAKAFVADRFLKSRRRENLLPRTSHPHCTRSAKLAIHCEPSFTLRSAGLPRSAYANRANGASNRVLSSDTCSKAREDITNAECQARFEGKESE